MSATDYINGTRPFDMQRRRYDLLRALRYLEQKDFNPLEWQQIAKRVAVLACESDSLPDNPKNL